jgi:hypothetical protein
LKDAKKGCDKLLKDESSNFTYWQQKTEEERLATIEMLRQQFIHFKYPEVQLRFQRVYRVVKQK